MEDDSKKELKLNVRKMEEEANDCVFQLPSWRHLIGGADDSESC